MEQSRKWGISGGTLKIIALVTMIIDHATAVFIANGDWYMIGRGIGRLAFPIYCFLIVEGFFHTRNVKKYMARLFLFALVSEIPFDLAFYDTIFYKGHQNVFFTLFLGIVLMYLIQTVRNGIDEIQTVKKTAALVASYVLVFAGAFFLQADYGMDGVVLILLFYLFHGRMVTIAFLNVLMNVFMGIGGNIQTYGGLSAIPIAFYNGKKGVSLKYFFYVIYPLHLLVFYAIRKYVG